MAVFPDSPPAISATEIFKRYPRYSDTAGQFFAQKRDSFEFPGLRFTRAMLPSL
jgi:hypothetical protein